MLKKLLLTSLTASALAACGGSVGPSAEDARAVLPEPEPQTNPVIECQPELVTYTFDAQGEVDEWYVNDEGTNIRLSHDPESQSALVIQPVQWTDEPSHKRQARLELDQPKDLQGATVEFKFNLPQAYIDDGGLALQFVLQGAGWWDSWISINDLMDAENTMTRVNPETGQITVTLTAPDNASVDGVTHIGMQLTSAPNDINITDPILLDRFTLYVPPGEECIEECTPETVAWEFESAEDVSEWGVAGGGDNFELTLAEGSGLAITPVTWEVPNDETWRRQAQLALGDENAMDLRGAEVTFTYDVPQAYLDDGSLRVQFPITGPSGNFYGEYVEPTQAEGNEHTVSFAAGDDSAEALATFGLQIPVAPSDTSILEPVILRSMVITLPCDEGGEGEQVVIDFVDGTGTVGNDGAVTLSHNAEEEALVIDPDFTDTANKSIFVILEGDQIQSFAGASIEFVVNVPQAYIDANLSLQPFIQQNEGSYTGDWSGWHDNGNLEAGDNTFMYFPEDVEGAARVGIQLKNVSGNVEEDLLLRSITITYAN